MIRGTTPLLTFTLPFDTNLIKDAYITFSQQNTEIFTLENEDCTFSENVISAKLTQEHTLKFVHNTPVEIQIRVLTTANDSLASNPIKTGVEKILKDGVI